MKPAKLYIDQYGQRYWARTLKELKAQTYGGRVSIMYSDLKDGRTVKAGYIIGSQWLSRYVPDYQEA